MRRQFEYQVQPAGYNLQPARPHHARADRPCCVDRVISGQKERSCDVFLLLNSVAVGPGSEVRLVQPRQSNVLSLLGQEKEYL